MIFTVKRLNITGSLDEVHTPIEVIKQCMTSHGFEPVWERLEDVSDVRYRRKCINKLINTPSLLIKDLRKAARYVNCETVFTDKDLLMESLEFLHQWETRDILENIFDDNVSIGPITEKNNRSLDCTILYRLCKQRGLTTRPEMTSGDMYRLLRLQANVSTTVLQDFIIDKVQSMTSTELLNRFSNFIPESFTFEREELYSHYLTNRELPSDPFGLFMPTTEHEAIILAASRFKIDISESSVPRLEYALLMKQGPSAKGFPIDSKLQDKIHQDSYSLKLDQRFNPTLPEVVYTRENLKRMALEEGWSSDDNGNPYEFLLSIFDMPSFFAFGKGPMANVKPCNSYLIIDRDTLDEKNPSDLVLFGKRSEPSSMTAISWSELIQTFENYREFRNVFSNTGDKLLFENFAMNKLVILARKPCIDQTIADRRKRLIAVIEKINLETRSKMKYLNGIKKTLTENPEFREQFKVLLDLLYRLSLSMRSLRDSEPLPENGEGGKLDSETTQMNVSLAAISLNDKVERVEIWVRDVFLNLPLVIYYPRENKFSTSETSFEGHTISGRLSIVHSGENTSAISSCLRLSSNWFLSTVYYYQSFFDYPVYFDITKLTHIG